MMDNKVIIHFFGRSQYDLKREIPAAISFIKNRL